MTKRYKYFIIKNHLIKFNFKFQHANILNRINRLHTLQDGSLQEIGQLWIDKDKIIKKDNYLIERKV